MKERQLNTGTARLEPDEVRRQFQELNLEHDYLFSKVMSDMEICRRVLEEILQISICRVSRLTTQHTIELLKESKRIRLDVYVNDEKGSVYNVEMQRGHLRRLPKRSRYYQGNIDLEMLDKGKKFEELGKSFIVFICTGDPFGQGRYLYTFQNTCAEEPGLCLGDEVYKIFVNTRGTEGSISEELRSFLGYVENSTDQYAESAKSELVKRIHEKVKQVKEHKELEVEFMTLLERERDIWEEALEQGLERGLEQGLERGLEQGMRQGAAGMIHSLSQYNIPREAIREQLILQLHISQEEAESYVKQYLDR